jgi:hypothetical protein
MYETVYQITDMPVSKAMVMMTVFIVIGVSSIFVGLREAVRRRRGKVPPHRPLVHVFFPILFGCIFACGGSLIFSESYQQRSHLVREYEAGRGLVVEGTVSVLHTQPVDGHDRGDIIRIGGREFELSAFSGETGYKQTLAHGGVLADGVRARLTAVDDQIVQIDLWVDKPTDGRSQE